MGNVVTEEFELGACFIRGVVSTLDVSIAR